jgi:antitoxin HicB
MSIVAEDEVRRYLGLPYRISLMRDGGDDDRPWRASVDELVGCETRGSTPAEAAARIPAALAEWVASARSEGREVPEPRDPRSYSGKLLLRMPQSLHGDLAQAAERDQVSLNAYITGLLAAAIQWRRPDGSVPTGEPSAEGLLDDDDGTVQRGAERVARLQRFLALALIANVAVVAIAASIAVALLVTAW